MVLHFHQSLNKVETANIINIDVGRCSGMVGSGVCGVYSADIHVRNQF